MSHDPPGSGLFLGPADAPYEYRGGKLIHNLILFGRVCRALGMNVTPNRMMDVARALAYIQLGRKQDFYYALRTHLVTHPKEFAYFDEAFDIFWRRPAEGFTTLNLQSLGEERRKKKTQFLPPLESSPSENGSDSKELDPAMITVVPTYSRQERLRHKDFAEMTAEELEMAKRVMAKMPDSLGMRKTRRFQSGQGRQINMRRLMKDVIRKHGDVTHLPTHRRKEKPRPVVLLCDISGSMERYTRVLLHFMHTLAGSLFQVESFLYSTDITRITRQIRQKNVDDALEDVGQRVLQWGGGTMTGECLHRFNWVWSRRVLGRGAVVILITDRLGPWRYPSTASGNGAAATCLPPRDMAESLAGCAGIRTLDPWRASDSPLCAGLLADYESGESGSDRQGAEQFEQPFQCRALSQAIPCLIVCAWLSSGRLDKPPLHDI